MLPNESSKIREHRLNLNDITSLSPIKLLTMQLKAYLLSVLMLLAATFTADAQRSNRNKVATPLQPAVSALDTIITENPVPADSFSIAAGIALSQSLRMYATQNLGVDEANMDDFVEGLRANVDEAQAKKLTAYAAGITIALQNKNQVMPSINREATGSADSSFVIPELYVEGLVIGLNNTDSELTKTAQATMERQFSYQKQVYQYANTKYLVDKAKENGVVSCPSGLQYRIVERGQGIVATDTSTVEVHYEGRLIDGTIFDSSYQRGQTAEFKPTQVIKGWHEALTMMPEGSTWELFIPYNLAYGERGNQNIPPYSTLFFKVQVVKVK